MRESGPSPRRRLRLLSDEEIALWLSVAQTVTPRPGAILPNLSKPAPEQPAAQPRSAVGATPTPVAPRGTSVPSLAPLDRRLRQRLSRGKIAIDGVLDLHGLTQQEAHSALHGFLLHAQSRGAKLVLIITGKGESRTGENSDGGVLRRSVPHWLGAARWRNLVVGFEEATRPHGGAGALYVRLRRRDRRDP